MAETAAAQLHRILHLIPHLSDGELHPLAEVAAKARVPEETVLRDLQSISDRFEAPGGFVEGLQIYIEAEGVSVHSNHLLRPMRLTRGELCALELGLAMLRRERTPEEHPAIDGALRRLREAMVKLPEDDAGDAVTASVPVPPGRLEHLRAFREAQREHLKVRLRYRGSGDRDPSQRVVCPYAIVFASGMWYTVAHCESSDGVRFFRLDRVEDVQVLDARFAPAAPASLEEIVRDGRAFRSDAAGTLTLRYSARVARWIAEREGKPLSEDGTLTVEHPLADTDWAVRHVLQYGPEVTVLEPDEVRLAVVRRLERMIAPAQLR
jgi:proteasome accessory factor C